jgi:predicted transcriptional regulator
VKTAISIPDDLFRLAETAARKLRMSRSHLYATAIAEFLERRRSAGITRGLNEVYSNEPAKLDPVLEQAQLDSIEKDGW